jgi:hypothetical protein
VAAHGWVRVPAEAVADLRRQPGPAAGLSLPANLLRQCDEQTVVALAAVLRAVHDHGLDPETLTDWGVLAAPLYLGRAALAAALHRFRAEGAWGVSPHLVPHRSMHSPSGALSFALKMRGPNFGVGGGPGCASEALLAAAALLARRRPPGVWVVFSAFEPNAPPDRLGGHAAGVACAALALALTPPGAGRAAARLRVRPASAPAAPPQPTALARGLTPFRLQALFEALARGDGRGAPLGRPLEAGGWVELVPVAAARRDVPHGPRPPAAAFSAPLSPAEAER